MKTALGKGLSALIPERGQALVVEMELARIVANADQPRKKFEDHALKELAESIKERGVLQPVLVARQPEGFFRLIAGERRYRAAKLAGLARIPAIVKDATPEDVLELALIENIQREDLTPLETARAFDRIMKQYGLTQELLAQKVSKERATVANYLRLLSLPDSVQAMMEEGKLTMGHAKALLSLDDQKAMLETAQRIVAEGLSVREAEGMAKVAKARASKPKVAKDTDVASLEQKLIKSLGTKVSINHKGKRGSVVIEYYSLDELDRLLEILMP